MTSSAEGEPHPTPTRWVSTYHHLASRPTDDLDPSDLESLAVAAYLMGDDDRCATSWEAAHRRHIEEGNRPDAARCSFWLAFSLMMRGQMAQAGGWLGRTKAVIGDDLPCSARGYLLIPSLLSALDAGDPAGAHDLATQAAAIANEFADADLAAFACLGDGQAQIRLGEIATGVARFDEVMIAVSTGEVGPIVRGVVYCAVILECIQIFDLKRAAEWTGVLHAWCEDQPELVPYRGQCLVHRSQVQQAQGAWPTALNTIEAACQRLSEPPHPALGLAQYQEAELLRLLGRFDEASAAYGGASANGQEPMPGLALLALDRGVVADAVAGIRRALRETTQPTRRPTLLASAVDIYRAAGALAEAREATDELLAISRESASEVLRAMGNQAVGAVTLSEGDPSAALPLLREARSGWARAHMPHDVARTSVLLGLACLSLGDLRSAELEFTNAETTFEALGALPDLERLRSLRARSGVVATAPASAEGVSTLSAREREVLAHVAQGKTNREIAAELSISQNTVGRHLENIFTKLGVSSRAAATAYAYQHSLL